MEVTVALILNEYTGPIELAANSTAHFSVVFSDTAGEDDEVGAVEHGDHRGDLLANGIAEHSMASRASAFDRCGFMQAPHVAADAGNSQQAGTAIDQLLEHGRVSFFSRIR